MLLFYADTRNIWNGSKLHVTEATASEKEEYHNKFKQFHGRYPEEILTKEVNYQLITFAKN